MQLTEYEIMFNVETTHWWYRALRRILLFHFDQFLPNWRSEPILDAGCGTGSNLAHLVGAGSRVGLDLAAPAIQLCRKRGLENLVRADVSSLPFPDKSFAALISASVLYHRWVKDMDQALRESHRVLRDGGLLFLDLPAFSFLTSPHDEAVHTARRFTKSEVLDLVRANGFEVRRITYWNTLLFPLIWLVRFSGMSKSGRDFGDGKPPAGLTNSILDLVMRAEFFLLRRTSLPFGVSISCVAVRRANP